MLLIELAQAGLKHFLEEELGDYSYYTEGMDITYEDSYDNTHNFTVTFPEGSWNDLNMKVSNVPSEMPEEDDYETAEDKLDSIIVIEVCLYEDTYETVVNFDWRVRYLWQALLWK
jgi:hypothetical protein